MDRGSKEGILRTLATNAEEQAISRAMMIWINSYPDLPDAVSRVDFEQLPADKVGMSLSVTQGTYIIKRYITGGHVAEYAYTVTYRVKPAASNDARLKADEILNALADWQVSNPPSLGEGIRVTKVENTARAAMLVPYENGDEDHLIQMKLTYEVI